MALEPEIVSKVIEPHLRLLLESGVANKKDLHTKFQRLVDCKVSFDTFNRWINLSGYGPLFSSARTISIPPLPSSSPSQLGRDIQQLVQNPENHSLPPTTRKPPLTMGGGKNGRFESVGVEVGDAVEVTEVGLPPPAGGGPPPTFLGNFG